MAAMAHSWAPRMEVLYPIGSMYGIYANIWGILMVNVTIYSIHGSYGYMCWKKHILGGYSLLPWKHIKCVRQSKFQKVSLDQCGYRKNEPGT